MCEIFIIMNIDVPVVLVLPHSTHNFLEDCAILGFKKSVGRGLKTFSSFNDFQIGILVY